MLAKHWFYNFACKKKLTVKFHTPKYIFFLIQNITLTYFEKCKQTNEYE